MKKFILLSLLFMSSYAHAMDSSNKTTTLGFVEGELIFNENMRKKIENLLLYKTSTNLFPHVRVTLNTDEDRQQIQYEEGKLMGIEETAGSECLIILQNNRKRMLFPNSITNIEKALTRGEKILKALQTINPIIERTIQTITTEPSNSNSIAKAKITYTKNGSKHTMSGHISKPTEKRAKLGSYMILPVLIKHGRSFKQQEIPLAHIIAVEKVNPKRSKSTSPKGSRKSKLRPRASSSSK